MIVDRICADVDVEICFDRKKMVWMLEWILSEEATRCVGVVKKVEKFLRVARTASEWSRRSEEGTLARFCA